MINIPWTYSRDRSTHPAEAFDDLQCVSLEYHYQCFQNADEQGKQAHRFVQIDAEKTIDIQEMKEKSEAGGQGLLV